MHIKIFLNQSIYSSTMILLVFISLACFSSVFARIENYAIPPEQFVEIDNSDMVANPEMLYMNYKDAKIALKSILASINNLNSVSFDNKDRPRKKQADKVTDTRQNNIMIDNFGYVIRYKTDRIPDDDNERFDRERRDVPIIY